MRRVYREWFKLNGFKAYEISYKYSNLFIKSCKDNRFEVFDLLKKTVDELESYIGKRKEFLTSLKPIKNDKKAPKIAQDMIEAAKQAGVGPMAAVAGAIAQKIGSFLLKICDECVIENGGDVFLKLKNQPEVGIYTNNTFFKDKLRLILPFKDKSIGICSSSAKIGPSLSKGKADLAVIVAEDTALADALATASANLIKTEDDVQKAIEFTKTKNILGCLFIKDKKLGIWGNLSLA